MLTSSSGDRRFVLPQGFSRYAPAASAVVCAGIMVVGFAQLGGASVAPNLQSGSSSGCYTHASTGSTATAPAINGLVAANKVKAKTVTVTRTKTVTKTVTKCGTKTVTRIGPGSTTTVTQTGPGETTTVTVTQVGPTKVVTETTIETVTSTGTTTETETTTETFTTTFTPDTF